MEYVDPDGRPKFGAKTCALGHPLWLLTEGYAYCYDAFILERPYCVWKFTPPSPPTDNWEPYKLSDGTTAWARPRGVETLEEVLATFADVGSSPSPLLPYPEWLATVS